MPSVRSLSGRIDIFEDQSHSPDHADAPWLEAPDSGSPGDTLIGEDHLYQPVAGYQFDENEMLNKLKALEQLSHVIQSAAPLPMTGSRTASIISDDDAVLKIERVENLRVNSPLGGRKTRNNTINMMIARKTSDAFSDMPPDLYTPLKRESTINEHFLTPLSHRKIRHRLSTSTRPYSATHERISHHDSPQRFLSSPQAALSDRQRSSPFRNPSSVREMQMSSPSPSPFPHTPRSARHRRSSITSQRAASSQYNPVRPGSRFSQHNHESTPKLSPPAQHPNPLKEYLSLIHI